MKSKAKNIFFKFSHDLIFSILTPMSIKYKKQRSVEEKEKDEFYRIAFNSVLCIHAF